MAIQSMWRHAKQDRFRLLFWEGDLTGNVYDIQSGETHCLSMLAVELLHILDSDTFAGSTIASIASSLAEYLGGAEEAERLVQDEMARLQRIGLVESVC